MIVHGVRNYIVQCVTGRPIVGYVRRMCLEEYGGQCVTIKVSGTIDALNKLVEELLNEKLNTYWQWEQRVVPRVLTEISNHSYSILRSTYGAESGPGSDPSNDFVQVRTSRSSRTESSSGSAKSSNKGRMSPAMEQTGK